MAYTQEELVSIINTYIIDNNILAINPAKMREVLIAIATSMNTGGSSSPTAQAPIFYDAFTNRFTFKELAVTAFGTDNYTATVPGLNSLELGTRILVKFENPNTAEGTLNVNGLGAKSIAKNYTDVLSSGDLKGSFWLVYDSENWVVVGKAGNFIPIAGTETGKEVTGPIVAKNPVSGLDTKFWKIVSNDGLTEYYSVNGNGDAYFNGRVDTPVAEANDFVFKVGSTGRLMTETGYLKFEVGAGEDFWQANRRILYGSDLSSTYNNRTLVDKGFVDTSITNSAIVPLIDSKLEHNFIDETTTRKASSTFTFAGTVRTCGVGGTYATISAAYAACISGDIIQLADGIYDTALESGGYLLFNTALKDVLILRSLIYQLSLQNYQQLFFLIRLLQLK